LRGNINLSPKLLERWRGEWRAQGELAFPGNGRRSAGSPAVDDAPRIGELERKIGQLTMENDSLKKALQIRRYCPHAPNSPDSSELLHKYIQCEKKHRP
jgi:transposase-like protein